MKKIVICINPDQDSIDLKRLKDTVALDQADITIVSIIKLNTFNFNLEPYIFPQDIHYELIRLNTLKKIQAVGETLLLDSTKLKYEVQFDLNPKTYVQKYLTDKNTDLVVMTTREKNGIKGFFSTSFVSHFLNFSPCDILILRP